MSIKYWLKMLNKYNKGEEKIKITSHLNRICLQERGGIIGFLKKAKQKKKIL